MREQCLNSQTFSFVLNTTFFSLSKALVFENVVLLSPVVNI